jgi:hypothetical protein
MYSETESDFELTEKDWTILLSSHTEFGFLRSDEMSEWLSGVSLDG